MPAINPEHLKSVIEMINNAPFFKHLAMRVTQLDKGFSEGEVSIGNRHMNPFGGVHGGVYSCAIDTMAFWSAYCDLKETQGLITIDLKVDLLAPVIDEMVFITGKRVKSGKTLFLTEAQMANQSGKLLAHGTSKLMVTEYKQTIHEAVDYLSAEKLPHKFLDVVL